MTSTTVIDAYAVNNFQIFKYAIKLDSYYAIKINISNITKICPQTFEFDHCQAVNKSISLPLLRNYDIISNIGHCLLNSIDNNKQYILNEFDNERNRLNIQISKYLNDINHLNNQISILQTQLQQYQIDIQVYIIIFLGFFCFLFVQL